MTFDETPDYDFLRELFATAMKNNGDEDDQMYDWMKLNDGQGWQKTVSGGTHVGMITLLIVRPRPQPMSADETHDLDRTKSTRIEWRGCEMAVQLLHL